jgi:hypothetical protein
MYVHFLNKASPHVQFFDLFGQRRDFCLVLRDLEKTGLLTSNSGNN